MTEVTNELIFDVLKTVQTDLADLKDDVSVLKESVVRIDARIASMESHMAGFHTRQNWHSQELDEHRGRLEGLEREDDKPKD